MTEPTFKYLSNDDLVKLAENLVNIDTWPVITETFNVANLGCFYQWHTMIDGVVHTVSGFFPGMPKQHHTELMKHRYAVAWYFNQIYKSSLSWPERIKQWWSPYKKIAIKLFLLDFFYGRILFIMWIIATLLMACNLTALLA